MLDTYLFKKEMEKVIFPIDIREIPTIPTEMSRVLVRTDTDAPLGLVKSKYKWWANKSHTVNSFVCGYNSFFTG